MTAVEDLATAVQTLVLDHQIIPCGPDPAPWYGDSAVERAEAAELCTGCSVLDLCAVAADEAGERWGVWGGADRQPRPPVKSKHRTGTTMKEITR